MQKFNPVRMNVGFLAAATTYAIALASAVAGGPALKLHPDNPHYFLYRGKPTVLITSGEHYGAVVNQDFNYLKYLDTLAADQLNLTRTWAGAYVEPAGAFNIADNTLAPKSGRFIAPWARADVDGYAGGGKKFDLTRWNDAYFTRLKDFVGQAEKRGIIVEMNLFCPMYDQSQWKVSPMNSDNNINGWGQVASTNVYTLKDSGGLLEVQEKLVTKIVQELQSFDNVYYEICNEPYFGGVTMEWQHHIADVIMKAQKDHASPKLISQNIANKEARVEKPHPAVSIFNFHYATPPTTVALNYGLNKALGDNETGFDGTSDRTYRREAWDFLLAGGALYNNLDYSFTVGHEQGDFAYPSTQPGGGTPELRKQLHFLADFMKSLPFLRMKPDNSVLESVTPDQISARALVEPGKVYAVYVSQKGTNTFAGPVQISLKLPAGSYQAEWINPVDGQTLRSENFQKSEGTRNLTSPEIKDDLALRIRVGK
jgi:hypothetical protein